MEQGRGCPSLTTEPTPDHLASPAPRSGLPAALQRTVTLNRALVLTRPLIPRNLSSSCFPYFRRHVRLSNLPEALRLVSTRTGIPNRGAGPSSQPLGHSLLQPPTRSPGSLSGQGHLHAGWLSLAGRGGAVTGSCLCHNSRVWLFEEHQRPLFLI